MSSAESFVNPLPTARISPWSIRVPAGLHRSSVVTLKQIVRSLCLLLESIENCKNRRKPPGYPEPPRGAPFPATNSKYIMINTTSAAGCDYMTQTTSTSTSLQAGIKTKVIHDHAMTQLANTLWRPGVSSHYLSQIPTWFENFALESIPGLGAAFSNPRQVATPFVLFRLG